MRKIARSVVAGFAAAALLAACSSNSPSTTGSGTSGSTSGAITGTITVLAASSLTGAFTTIAQRFEAAHPGVHVTFSFGASDVLAAQITSGAPADVFASASPKTMDTVTKAGDASNPQIFATNVLEIATPPTNPKNVASISDLTNSSVKVALCEASVPCGEVAEKMFAKNHLKVTAATYGADVKAVLTYVELNEVDAGVVYVTDVLAAGSKVKGVPIPASQNESTSYPIATISKSSNLATANAFKAFVLSSDGQKVLSDDGFGAP
jgi:molybdate transport system substrate-binding protein